MSIQTKGLNSYRTHYFLTDEHKLPAQQVDGESESQKEIVLTEAHYNFTSAKGRFW